MSGRPWRLRVLADRLADRLGKSSHVFLLVLLVLCSIEVLVDWNQALTEINVLRASLRDKATNYADLLRKAAERPLAGWDWDELDRLSTGLFEDRDLIYVRYSDALGNVVYDRVRPETARAFEKKRRADFRAHYRRVMDRDAGLMLTDPARLKERMEKSRHTDFVQKYTDARDRLVAWVTRASPPAKEPAPRALYQDRLADLDGKLDRSLSWALGAVAGADGEPEGVVLVAFSNAGLNRATVSRLVKGAAVTLFFVVLIIVQNVMARRAKLRLYAIEAALSAARRAIREALPTPPAGARTLTLALAQAENLGGTVYDLRALDGELELVIAVPEGSGVDAAFASVSLRDQYRSVIGEREDAPEPEVLAQLILRAYETAPLGRKVALAILRVRDDGQARGVVAGLHAPARVDASGVHFADCAEPLGFTSSRLSAPLRTFTLDGTGAKLVFFDDGAPEASDRRIGARQAITHFAQSVAHHDDRTAADNTVAWAKKQARGTADDVLLAVVS